MLNLFLISLPSKWNKILLITPLLLIIILLSGCIGDRSSQIPKITSTNLENESINGLKLFDSIQDPEFIKKYGSKHEGIPNAKYNYYKLKDDLVIATNKKREIIRISTPSNDKSFSTSNNISVESTRSQIIEAYGPYYYERSDDLGFKVLGYVDNSLQRTIEFFFTVEPNRVLDHINLDLVEMN
jgi:hypothetical protein